MARDSNFVVTLQRQGQLAAALAAGADAYQAEGKDGRDKAKSEGEEYRGHPKGKKPDAMLRMLLYRINEAVAGDRSAVQAAIA